METHKAGRGGAEGPGGDGAAGGVCGASSSPSSSSSSVTEAQRTGCSVVERAGGVGVAETGSLTDAGEAVLASGTLKGEHPRAV
jgi:hypothetical protein